MRVATQLAGRRGARAIMPLLESQGELNEKMGNIFQSEINESIGALNNLDAEQIEGVESALDMDIDASQVTPREIVERMEQLNEQGESTEDIANRMQAALNISGDAAQAFAEDLEDADTSTEDLAEGIGGATTAADIAQSQMDTTAGSIEFMRSSFDAMTFTIFTGAAPAIEMFNSFLATGINLLNQHEGAMFAVGTLMAALTAGLGALTLALGAAWIQTTGLAAAQGLLANSFIGTAAAAVAKLGVLGALSAGFGAATTAAIGFMTALGPVGWALIAVTGLVLALVGIWQTDFLGAGSAAGSVLGWFGDRLGSAAGMARSFISGLWQLIRIVGMLAVLASPIGWIAGLLKFFEDPQRWIDAGKSAVMGLLSGLKGLLPEALAAVFPPALGLLAASKLAPDDWVERGRDMIGGLSDSIGGMMPGALLAVIPGVGLILAAANLMPDAWKERGVSMVEGLAEGIIPGPVLDSMGSLTDGIMSYLPFSDARRGALSRLSDSAATIPSMLADGILGGLSLVSGAMSRLGSVIEDNVPGASTAKDWGSSLAGGIRDGISDGTSAAKDAVSGVASTIGGALPSSDADYGPLSNLTQVGPALVNTIAGGMTGEEPTLGSAMSGVMGTVMDTAGATPLGQAASGIAGKLGLEMSESSDDSGASPSESTGSTSVTVELTQNITFEGDGDGQTEERVTSATENGAMEALSELERKLEQDMGGI